MVATLKPSTGNPDYKTPCHAHDVSWNISPAEDVYIFKHVLGTGHYGAVYAAQHRSSGATMAIKCLEKSNPEYKYEDVRNEVAIHARICDHPNIATLYEVYEDARHVCLVMEACLGGELFDMIIERKHFTETEASHISGVILSILRHCHDRGILYRDLKPENILLKNPVSESTQFEPTNLRAVDFGISAFLGSDGCTGVVGSSYYIAPEVLKGTACYGPPADAWSLGVLAFILISGYPPFWGGSDAIIHDRIKYQELHTDYQPWNTGEISSNATDFVRRLLIKDPAKRMTLMEAARHPWLSTETAIKKTTPLPSSIIERLRAFSQQNRLTCLLMTVVAHNISDAAISQLGLVLTELDTDGDGLVDVSDIIQALQTTGIDLAQNQSILEVLDRFVANFGHAGQVSVDEFLAAAIDRKTVFTQTAVAHVFNALDTDGDGKLSVAALTSALQECGVSIGADTMERMLQREGALNGKGVISPRSFSNLLLVGTEDQGRSATSALSRLSARAGVSVKSEDDSVQVSTSRLSMLSLDKPLDGRSDGKTALYIPPFLPEQPDSEPSTGPRLDELLRHYGTSGYRRPRQSCRSSTKSRCIPSPAKDSTPGSVE